jgi:sucrose phosphorylase
MWDKIHKNLRNIYSDKESRLALAELKLIVQTFKKNNSKLKNKKQKIDSSSQALITYANTIKDGKGKKTPLATLLKFINKQKITNRLKIIHILPFYPWDTDRGFSVIDYYKVNPKDGNWDDIKKLSDNVELMFDFVANHASIDNPIIQGALIERHLESNNPKYNNYKKYKDFVTVYSYDDKPSIEDLEKLARPRPNPVLTNYYITKNNRGNYKALLGSPTVTESNRLNNILGKGWVWTTFSRPQRSDGTEETKQVDLNFANPKVLIESIKILLFYVEKGATLIHLDAIGYIWKQLGSTSLHEPEAHLILETIHDVMKVAAPFVTTIAEVNEPQKKVLKYLGSAGHEESDLVYQFTHFPLAVYAVLTGNAIPYQKWLRTLRTFKGKRFITVLGSHDGMGLKPVRGFLTESQINRLTDILINKHHTLPNTAHLPGGKEIVYELCATPWNLINQPKSKDDIKLQINRYLAVVALGLSLQGIPAIYFNGLVGSPNFYPADGLDENRTVNREVFDYSKLTKILGDEKSHMHIVLKNILKLLKIRKNETLFNPFGVNFVPVDFKNKSIIGIKLDDNNKHLLSIINVSNIKQEINIKTSSSYIDLISKKQFKIKNASPPITLSPYQILWLKTE